MFLLVFVLRTQSYFINIAFTVYQVGNRSLGYDNLDEVRDRLRDIAPNLTRYGDVEQANFFDVSAAMLKVFFDYSYHFLPFTLLP